MGLARTVAAVFGVVYLLVGILGFLPALVTGGAPAGMPSATGNLIGIFPINALHNVVHLAIGAALLYGATATPAAIIVSRIVGIAYLLVGLLGLVSADGLGLLPLGGTDVVLHLATGAVLTYIGFAAPRARRRLPDSSAETAPRDRRGRSLPAESSR
jgi:hypothetical protein